MTKVRVHHDGWLALPAAVRERLDLASGDRLELELSGGVLLLRPLRSGTAAESAPEPAAPESPPAVAAPVTKRGPGRPRKTPLPAVPPTLKARGGRRKPATAGETASEP